MKGRFLLLPVLVLFSGPTGAQQAAFCNLTGIQTERLSNAVRVTIESDGLLEVYTDPGLYVDFAQWSPRPVDRLGFYLSNAKSQVGKFAEIGVYPVSHLELSIPPWAQGGVGVLLEVVLYAPARMRSMDLPGFQIDPGEEFGKVSGVTFDARRSENRSNLILTITSDLPIEQPSEKNLAERVQGRRRVLEVTQGPAGVSVHAVNADIHALFEALAVASGTPIVVDETVAHLVSAYLPELPVEEVIRHLAGTYGLSVAQVGESYLVGEAVERELVAYNLGVTEAIPLRYLSPKQAMLLLPNFLLRYVHADLEHNALLVSGPREMVEKLRQDLARIDLPAPQVEVEAVAVQVSEARGFLAALSLLPPTEPNPPLRDWSLRPEDGFLRYVDTANLPHDFAARLEALAARRQVAIRARASATAINGQPARLFLGRQRFIRVLRAGWQVQEAALETVEEGLTLEVTPWAGGGNRITAHLQPRLSDIIEVDPATGMPTLATRQAETNVLVRSGETIVLGGQVLQQRVVTQRWIPLLADLPVLGELFRTRRVRAEKSDLVLLVTLRVVE